MKYNPHNYQKYAAEFIITHPVSALLLDMGLGKTSITLTAINDLLFDRFEVHKVLVVAPLRVARDTWSAEIEKWEHLRELRYSVVVGTEQERISALRTPADIYIINRENLQWLVEQSGIPLDFDMAVIDELSSFKNHQSKRFKAFMKIRPKLKRIVGLTGTPAGNGLMDLFSEFKLLDMGERLGRFIGQYRNTYFQPDKRNGMVVYSYKPLPDAEQRIYDKISDITISMKATDHLTMPELVSTEYTVQLSEKEKEKYNRLKIGFTQQDGSIGIVEEEANTVRMIYDLFMLGHGYQYISSFLKTNGIPTKYPGSTWENTTVFKILHNEKYCGDCLFQKTYISDPIKHKSSPNRGELPQYFVEDVLPAIIPKDMWLAAQELQKRHAGKGHQHKESLPFSHMLICPFCGNTYVNYVSATHNKELVSWFRCKSYKLHTAVPVPGVMYTPPSRERIADPTPELIAYREKYNRPTPPRPMICSDIRIPREQPKKAFVQAWNLIVGKKTRYQASLQRTVITTENPLTRYRAKEMISLLDTVGRIKEFDFQLMLRTLDFVEVSPPDKLSFVFQCGIRITV